MTQPIPLARSEVPPALWWVTLGMWTISPDPAAFLGVLEARGAVVSA